MRAFISARSRYAEDELAQSVRGGVRQYVILGAGLDTFAYRNPYSARVFEVDHPATQAWKRERLEDGGIALPDNLTFVALDFETRTIADGLREAGYDPGVPTFFSWLGVTPYLTPEAVTSTLRFIASASVGSAVVFDYLVSPSLLTPAQRATFDRLAHWADSDGEPWRTFFDPESLKEDLPAMGFGQAENLGLPEINARYLLASSDEFHIGSLGRVMKATV
jgi:methyltransferase (TIGR00027 family)